MLGWRGGEMRGQNPSLPIVSPFQYKRDMGRRGNNL